MRLDFRNKSYDIQASSISLSDGVNGKKFIHIWTDDHRTLGILSILGFKTEYYSPLDRYQCSLHSENFDNT